VQRTQEYWKQNRKHKTKTNDKAKSKTNIVSTFSLVNEIYNHGIFIPGTHVVKNYPGGKLPRSRVPDGSPKYKYFRTFVAQQGVALLLSALRFDFQVLDLLLLLFLCTHTEIIIKADRVRNCGLFILRKRYCCFVDRTCCSWSLYDKVWTNVFTVLLRIYYSGYLTSQQRNKRNTFDILAHV